MNVYIPNLRLPSAYQEVEYIQSSGTQYINSGVNLTTNIGFEVDFNISNSIGFVGYAVLGGRYQGGDNELNLDTYYRSNGGIFAYGGGSEINPKLVPNTRQQCSFKNLVFTDCDGITTNVTSYTFNRTVPLHIFACIETKNASVVDKISMKLYSCKIYDGNTLVRDFVPCYRKSDGVIGLYDLVNSVFYTNSGTGTFSKGNDVIMSELKNAYIGEWKPFIPGSSTIAYYPLTTDFNDASGNGRNLTNSGGTITTVDGIKCAYYNGNSYSLYNGADISLPSLTINMWMKKLRNSNNERFISMGGDNPGREFTIFGLSTVGVIGIMAYYNNGFLFFGKASGISQSNWLMVTYVFGTNGNAMYVNGVQQTLSYDEGNSSTGIGSGRSVQKICLSANPNTGEKAQCNLSEVIIESKARTAQDIQAYYNLTKSNYGL